MKRLAGISILIAIIMTCGCNPEVTASTARHLSPSLTIAPSLTATSSPTPSQLLTETQTLGHTITPTVTIPPTIVWTPLPTLGDALASVQFLKWLQGPQDCRLPCWAGITPGQSNWQQSLQNLAPLAGVSKFTRIIDGQCTFGKCNYLSWLYYSPPDFEVDGEVYTILQDDKVYRVSIKVIKSSPPEGMSLTDILNNYGMPSSVLMDVNKEIQFEPNSNGVAAAILVLLAYPKNNSVIIFYYGADLQTNKFISCSKANTVQLFIYDDGTPLASYESLVNVPDVHRLRVTGWKKLEDVTNLTIDSFFTKYRTPLPPCIDTPVNDW